MFTKRRVWNCSASAFELNPTPDLALAGVPFCVTEALAVRGASDMLVNIGEFRGTGGPWRLGLSDPKHGHMGTRTITEGAVATSSPAATLIGTESHIMHPIARPKWSTVSVVADSATMADAVSTALVLADLSLIQNLVGQAGIRQITMVDFDGNLTTL